MKVLIRTVQPPILIHSERRKKKKKVRSEPYLQAMISLKEKKESKSNKNLSIGKACSDSNNANEMVEDIVKTELLVKHATN